MRFSCAVSTFVLLIAGGAIEAHAAQADEPARARRAAVAAPVNADFVRLTLEEAKYRALQASPVVRLAQMSVREKQQALSAVHADYLPKVLGSFVGLHFDRPLGQVFTLRNGASVPVNVTNQNLSLGMITAAQPITALVKVRGLERINEADTRIAQADVVQARRAVLSGVEQLYVSLWATRRLQSGAETAAATARPLAERGPLEVRAAYLEAVKATQTAGAQADDVTEQLVALIGLPPETRVVPAGLPELNAPVVSADDAAALAIQCSPEVASGKQTLEKACAALKIARADYLPDINALGGYANQNGLPAIQNNFGFGGITANYTLFDAGKRRHLVRKSEMDVAMARTALNKTRDEVAAKARKAFRNYVQSDEAVGTSRELASVRAKIATQKLPLKDALDASKENLTAQAELIEAQLKQRIAYAQLAEVTGQQ